MLPHPEEESLKAEVEQALQRAKAFTFDTVLEEGYWHGELKSNVTITSEYIFLRQAFGLDLDVDREAYRTYLLTEQNKDGSWGLAPDIPGDVSTTSEAYLALKILGQSLESTPMRRARDCVRRLGGIAKVRVFTRIFFATFGLFPWRSVPQLPVELILLPAVSPINVYKLASWARSTIVPLLLLCHHQPVYALPNAQSPNNDFLDELWLDPSEKAVPYSASIWNLLWNGTYADIAFTAVDNTLARLGGLRWVPFLRSYARKVAVQWILDRQEPSGDWAGIFPPMHGGIYALMLEGFTLTDRPVRTGIEALERFAVQDATGGKRIQPCVSPIWDTALTSIALCDSKPSNHEREHVSRAMDWIKTHQRLGIEGDWRVYRPQLAPGGWTFEIYNSWYPDVDDTAAVILALVKEDSRAATSHAVLRALEWILGMQNIDGGWAAFDVQNDALFLNRIPFSDMDSLCDPSSADVTGRVLEAFGLVIRTINVSEKLALEAKALIQKLQMASSRAIGYLASIQEPDGSWFGRWGSNYVYGTSNVLCGLAYFLHHEDAHISSLVAPAVQWLKSVQNEDGGWGESLLSYKTPAMAVNAPSTPSQTAWALMALLAHVPLRNGSIDKGVRWLLATQTCEGSQGASWPERVYTGTGFPNHFYLGYTLYRHYFPMMALGRYVQHL